jgi:serpin B
VASRTHGRIRDLVPANTLGQNTAAVLVDAVFFRAAWEEPFSARATATAPFTRAPGHPVPVRMMNLTTDLPYSETRDAQVVSLRYADARHSLVVILPRATNGLSALEARLTPGTLNGWLSGLSPRSVRLALPRFTMTHSERLDAALAAMGMPAAFDPAAADFSGIAPARRLWISAVLHRAFVAVDETGTEAAAATAVEMLMEMVVQHAHPSPFIADHPFLFLIRDDRTGVILFMGRVADPS